MTTESDHEYSQGGEESSRTTSEPSDTSSTGLYDIDPEYFEAPGLVPEYLNNDPEKPSDSVEEKARELALKADREYPVNRSPSTIAAGAIYMGALLVNEKYTQKEVAEISDVSATSVRKAYHDIRECWENERYYGNSDSETPSENQSTVDNSPPPSETNPDSQQDHQLSIQFFREVVLRQSIMFVGGAIAGIYFLQIGKDLDMPVLRFLGFLSFIVGFCGYASIVFHATKTTDSGENSRETA